MELALVLFQVKNINADEYSDHVSDEEELLVDPGATRVTKTPTLEEREEEFLEKREGIDREMGAAERRFSYQLQRLQSEYSDVRAAQEHARNAFVPLPATFADECMSIVALAFGDGRASLEALDLGRFILPAADEKIKAALKFLKDIWLNETHSYVDIGLAVCGVVKVLVCVVTRAMTHKYC